MRKKGLFLGIGLCDHGSWQIEQTRNSNRQAFCLGVLRKNYFFFRKPQSLFLRPLTDLMRPTYIMEDNLLYLKSTDCKC